MTGHVENNEFCFPKTLIVSRVFVLCYTSQLKTKKNCEEMVCFTPASS